MPEALGEIGIVFTEEMRQNGPTKVVSARRLVGPCHTDAAYGGGPTYPSDCG